MSISDPFFIFYDARSGSTFLARLLCEKTNVCIPPETNFLTSIIQEYGEQETIALSNLSALCRILRRDRKFSDWNVPVRKIRQTLQEKLKARDYISLCELVLCICDLYNQKSINAPKFGFKKGSYIFYFEQLKIIFPKAQFIHVIRDGRAVFNSKRNSTYSRTQRPFETDVQQAAQTWKQKIELSRHIEDTHPESSIIVHYENLMSNSESELNRLIKFLGLHLINTKSSHKPYRVPSRYKRLHENVGKSAIKDRIDSWKRNLTLWEVEAYEAIAGDTLKQEGYQLYSRS